MKRTAILLVAVVAIAEVRNLVGVGWLDVPVDAAGVAVATMLIANVVAVARRRGRR